jgi:RNA 2',3'-cyclic 3'-phosphodiesterase
MPRLFMALRVQPTFQIKRVLSRLHGVPGVAAVPVENLHYTLRFLGNVSDTERDRLLGIMREEHIHIPPFEIPIQGTSSFPDEKRPRVVWVGCKEEARGPLIALSRAADGYAEACGLGPRDKPFVPHLTLARIKVKGGKGMETAVRVVREEHGTDYGTVSAARVHLVESRLTPQGSLYTDLLEVRLG